MVFYVSVAQLVASMSGVVLGGVGDVVGSNLAIDSVDSLCLLLYLPLSLCIFNFLFNF